MTRYHGHDVEGSFINFVSVGQIAASRSAVTSRKRDSKGRTLCSDTRVRISFAFLLDTVYNAHTFRIAQQNVEQLKKVLGQQKIVIRFDTDPSRSPLYVSRSKSVVP